MSSLRGWPVFCIVAVCVFAGAAGGVCAATVRVPGDQATIQGALDTAVEGDEIVVSRGNYREQIQFHGRNVILRSVDPTSASVVQATRIELPRDSEFGPVVTFTGDEGTTCVLSGFVIKRGWVSEHGGGIRGNGTKATIQYNHIVNNAAESGGGMAYCDGLIYRNRIADNVAPYPGGGLFRCNGTIQENEIVNNFTARIDGTSGGGLFNCDGVIVDNIIAGNLVASGSGSYGGGLAYCEGVIHGNEIRGNRISKEYQGHIGMISQGGGMYRCTGDIRYNRIEDNVSDGTGGGMAICYGLIADNWITGNFAEGGGGGFAGFKEEELIIERNWIVGNRTNGPGGGLWGGGIYPPSGPEMMIRNNVVAWNTARTGAGVLTLHGYILNNVIYGNVATETGGGIRGTYGTIQNNILWGNEAPEGAQVLETSPVLYNCIQDWTAGGEGNIVSDPLFVDPENGDFRLSEDSPCIDAGRLTLDVLEDFDGNPRPMDGSAVEPRGDGSGWDIGAFEHPGEVLPLPPPDAGLIRDAILRRIFPRPWMDLDEDGQIEVSDLLLAIGLQP